MAHAVLPRFEVSRVTAEGSGVFYQRVGRWTGSVELTGITGSGEQRTTPSW